MTQRHADSDDETYVTVGRPFERLETAEDVQKAKARKDKDQYVTDSQGRRRFHGAFTGGFSAGYYNTVGSEEGWTPSSFVSSRSKRSEFGGQRPEDFMDEEDFGAHGIAPKIVSAKEQFDQSEDGESRKRAARMDSGVIPGVPPLQNLVVPSKSSVGAQLLKAMGWREGEGVGPKVVKYQPQQDPKARVYGPARPEEPSKMAEGFMFAPQDSTPWEFSGKDDLHGLGYRGMEERGVLAPRKSTKALHGMRGEAFGTGALEDEDDDDENVYGVESMTSYDVSLAGEGDLNMERSFGWTGRETDTWDLSSFTKALKKPAQYKSHPPPQVPRSFVPVHKFSSTATDTSLGKPLSSADRTQLLSDNAGSVFGLLSPVDRERLKHAAEQTRCKSDAPTTQTTEQPAAAEGGKTETEWESGKKERMARAADLFKPLSESLSSRFTRSQDQEEPPKSPESDAIQAARANMFGALTREIQDWYPHRIVCKRFNVPDPYPGQSFVGLADGKRKGADKNRAISFELTEKMVTTQVPEQEQETDTKQEDKKSKEDAEKTEEVEEAARPPMDLFKAIFAGSDSSSSSDESDDVQQSSTATLPTARDNQTPTINIISRQQPTQSSSKRRWKDLSVITSHVQPVEEAKMSSSSLHSKFHSGGTTEKGSDQPQLVSATSSVAECHRHSGERSHSTSYGPSLPPSIQQHSDSQMSTSVSRRHSHSHDREKHKKSHKKHKKEDKGDHREHKKKHKHSTHSKH